MAKVARPYITVAACRKGKGAIPLGRLAGRMYTPPATGKQFNSEHRARGAGEPRFTAA